MFEICSNGFSHFKLSQNGCKSSSLVNEHENVKIEFQIPVGRVFFFFIRIDNIKSLKKIFLLRINWASAPHPLALKKEFRGKALSHPKESAGRVDRKGENADNLTGLS